MTAVKGALTAATGPLLDRVLDAAVWIRAIGSRTMVPPLSAGNVLFWRNDIL
jgi:hypothetical protein